MKKPTPLSHKRLCQKLNPRHLRFETTADLESLTEFLGQERALEAIHFGIGIKSAGYNLYAMGPSGIGKRSLIRTILENQAAKEMTAQDWCYIHNFEVPDRPLSLQLPPGIGSSLQQDMKNLIEKISLNVVAMFESDQYREGMQKITNNFKARRKNINRNSSTKLKNKKIPHLYKELHKNEKEFQLQLTAAVVDPLIEKLISKYSDVQYVVFYLTAVQQDIIAHINEFLRTDENNNVSFPLDNPALIKYQVNLLVDCGKRKEAPVIFEENPSYSNLICRVEHAPQQGALITNFMLIRPGALHKANGGYLVIEARKLRKSITAWEGLKRALYSKKIRIEPIEHLSDAVRPVSIEPQEIPLNVKIILLGERNTFYSFFNHDPDFTELFKVAVDFDNQIERNKKNIQLFSRLIGTIAKKQELRPFHASAVAAIVDYSSRYAEDTNKLSTHIRSIGDLIVESNYWASLKEKKQVEAHDVKRAIEAQIHRVDREREHYYEYINRNFILIKTSGKSIGQVNCLSVVTVGQFSYGHPTLLTAKVRAGKGNIIDIQHEVKMAGPIMSKGGMIISHFLASRYNPDEPFSLTASLAFEQIYGEMEGDSASIAEVCALLSALADVPINQSLAITGSTNQYGEVQSIGGVNEKIEGFFDICHARGLTGKQGVLIPAINAKNLMLRDDVVQAAKQKKFSIYLIDTIDQAIAILTGVDAGKRNKQGKFPVNSINYKVEKRLTEFSRASAKKKNRERE